MKVFEQIAVFALVAGVSAAPSAFVDAQEKDSLFSSVHAATAFSSGVTTGEQDSGSHGVMRLTSTEEIVHMLQEANFEATVSGTRTAATQKPLNPWIFPVLVTLSEDEQNVSVILGLRAVNNSEQIPATRLLQLLASNETCGPSSFAFNRERNRIELYRQVRNSGVNAQSLRDEINRLAILARDTESLWNLEESAGGAASTETTTSNGGATKGTVTTVPPPASAGIVPTATTPQSAAPTPGLQISSNSLQGRWAASRSANEAFAILLNSDGTFMLVSVISGQQARSSGKYTIQDSQLTLETSDGGRLPGKITLISASEFRFEQQTNGTALTFRKAP